MKTNDPLDQRLQAWDPELPLDPQLKAHVMQRIGWEGEARAERRFRRPSGWRIALAGGLAASLLLFLGSIIGHFWGGTFAAEELARQQLNYRILIDPVFHVETSSEVQAASDPGVAPNLVKMLAWMQNRLDLDQEQFLALLSLHEEYEGSFERLYRDLSEVQLAYDGFEARRTADQMVDFIALFELLEHRKSLEANAHDTSAALVQRVLTILRPDQERDYLAVIESAPAHTNASKRST